MTPKYELVTQQSHPWAFRQMPPHCWNCAEPKEPLICWNLGGYEGEFRLCLDCLKTISAEVTHVAQ